MAKASSSRRSGGRQPKRAPKGPVSVGAPRRPTSPAKTYTSKPVRVDFAGPEHRFVRADLEIRGIFHGEASYEGRIFFNNPKANEKTPRTPENGYAGSFHIFGHGGCLGDPGHCDLNEHNRNSYDFRAPNPLTPALKRITVTNALRQLAATTKEVMITIVPVVAATNDLCDDKNVFRFEGMRFLTYDG